jgi:transcriptional regulator with XRE-family HTH domain
MLLSESIRIELAKRLRHQSLYSVALGANISLVSLSRWYSRRQRSIGIDSLDALAAYLGLELATTETSTDLSTSIEFDTSELSYSPIDEH